MRRWLRCDAGRIQKQEPSACVAVRQLDSSEYLLTDDPWRIVRTTDHPNGGVFWAYPQLVRLLMDANYRQEILKTLPRAVRENRNSKILNENTHWKRSASLRALVRRNCWDCAIEEHLGNRCASGYHDLFAAKNKRRNVSKPDLYDSGRTSYRRAWRDPNRFSKYVADQSRAGDQRRCRKRATPWFKRICRLSWINLHSLVSKFF